MSFCFKCRTRHAETIAAIELADGRLHSRCDYSIRIVICEILLFRGRPVEMKILKAALLSVVMLASCATYATSQRIKAVPDKDSASILTIAKATGELPNKIEGDGAGESTLRLSPNRAFRAYVLCIRADSTQVPNCVSRVFIRNEKSKTVYEIRGEELGIEAGRPVDELKWRDTYTLSYERWTGPHYGHRYVINVRTLKQIAAYSLTDR